MCIRDSESVAAILECKITFPLPSLQIVLVIYLQFTTFLAIREPITWCTNFVHAVKYIIITSVLVNYLYFSLSVSLLIVVVVLLSGLISVEQCETIILYIN